MSSYSVSLVFLFLLFNFSCVSNFANGLFASVLVGVSGGSLRCVVSASNDSREAPQVSVFLLFSFDSHFALNFLRFVI